MAALSKDMLPERFNVFGTSSSSTAPPQEGPETVSEDVSVASFLFSVRRDLCNSRLHLPLTSYQLDAFWLKPVQRSLLAFMDCEFSGALLANHAEQQRTRKDVRAVRARVRRMQRSGAQDNSRIGPLSELIVLILYATGGSAVPAVEYLQRYKRRYHTIDSSADDLTAQVESWVLDLPQDGFNMLLGPQTGMRSNAFNIARQSAAEHAAVFFVENNNEEKGVAPPTEVVMRKLEEELVGARRLAEDIAYDACQDLRVSRHKVFAWRFRRRWKVALDRLRENAYVSPDERREKASIFSPDLGLLASFLAPFFWYPD